MRIAFALNSGEGGATLSACELMAELDARGHTCFAVLPPSASAEGRARVARVAEDTAFVHLPWWNRNYRARAWKRPLLALRDAMKSGGHAGTVAELALHFRRWRADLVHTNTAVTLEPALAARLSGRAHVWHIREHIGARDLYRFWLPERALAATFVALSDAVIANSHATLGLFARTGFADAVTVVHNGVDVRRFDRAGCGAALRAAWGAASPDTFLAGMVASLGSRMKRHDLFVQAAAIVAREAPSARFVIAGADPDAAGGFSAEVDYARSVKALARELGLADRLVFAGHHDDVAAIMDALDLLVHPFEAESFGRVAIEAMAAHRAVAGANGGGIAEIVEDGVTGWLVPPQDPEALAAAILAALRDPARRRGMGERGHARAEACFSLAQTTRAVESVYDRALARRPPLAKLRSILS